MLSENFGIQLQGNIVCIGSVAVSMLASSAVDLGTTSGQVIAKTMELIVVASPLSMPEQTSLYSYSLVLHA
jgi:hypothetical protein